MIIIGDETDLQKPSVDEKIRELCEAILSDEGVISARRNVDAFFEDDHARELYSSLAEKTEELQHKQHRGEQLTDEDMADYNKARDRAFSNPTVQSFSASRAALQEVEDKVVAYVEKTLELGRVPEEEEVQSGGGCCNSGGCGCH